MTDYNGEQNNIIGMAQPTDAQPIIPTEPQAAVAPVESQIAVSEAPVSDAPADIQVAVSEAPPTESVPINDAPASVQPTAPVNQAPVIPPTAPQPPKNSKAPIFIGIGIFLVGVIIALILVFVLVGNNDEDERSKGNKTETEQTEDKPSSEDDNDEDEDNKDADEDKNNTDKGNSDKDNSSEDDKTDKGDDDDTPVDAVVDAEYTEFLDAFCDVYCGDVSQFEKLLPEALWNLMRVGFSEDFGYIPTKDEILEMLEIEADGAEFADEATYVILEESVADDEAIGYMQETLQEVLIFDEIEEAYEIRIVWTIEADGKTLEYEEVAYAVYIDGEWTLMSKNYIPYIMDAEGFEQATEDTFGENFV